MSVAAWAARWRQEQRERLPQERARLERQRDSLRADLAMLASDERRIAEIGEIQRDCGEAEARIARVVAARQTAELELARVRRARAAWLLDACGSLVEASESAELVEVRQAWRAQLPLDNCSPQEVRTAMATLGEPAATRASWIAEVERIEALLRAQASVLEEVDTLGEALAGEDEKQRHLLAALLDHADASGEFETVLGYFGVGPRPSERPLDLAMLGRVRGEVLAPLLRDLAAEDAWEVDPDPLVELRRG